jgi:hypothetical protein
MRDVQVQECWAQPVQAPVKLQRRAVQALGCWGHLQPEVGQVSRLHWLLVGALGLNRWSTNASY